MFTSDLNETETEKSLVFKQVDPNTGMHRRFLADRTG